ncbi:hypothetical protein ACJZ2D_004808 [Fusarium nematophilum]
MGFEFTFVNTSNAPALGQAQAKEMRAHITKTNFARRRQRLAREMQQRRGFLPDREVTPDALPKDRARTSPLATQAAFPPPDPGTDLLLFPLRAHLDWSINYLLYEFRPIVFPAGTGSPGSDNETAWVDLLLSEPALVEASMAIALTYSSRWDSREGDVRKGRAIHMINQRLDSPLGLTDGVLGAVFTLTFAERLANNETALNVHVEGLAQMIKLRRSSGEDTIPPWFSDFLLYDSIGQAIAGSNDSHQKLIDALRKENKPTSVNISRLSREIDHFRKALDAYYTSEVQSHTESTIDFQVEYLQLEVELLLGGDEHYIRALRHAVRLFLLLSWPPKVEVDVASRAEELRTALSEPRIRLCSSIELTVWQFFVGAVAAGTALETRIWFVGKLQRIFLATGIKEWKGVMPLLRKAFVPGERLLGKFEMVWRDAIPDK